MASEYRHNQRWDKSRRVTENVTAPSESWDDPSPENDTEPSYAGRKQRTTWRTSRRRNENGESNWRQDKRAGETRTFMTVNSSKVGKIIGRQGTKIRELQDTSGALVSVGKSDEFGNVKITIVGTAESQEKCKQMIEELTEECSLFSQGNTEPFVTYEDEETPRPIIDWDALNKAADEYEKKRWTNAIPVKKDFYFEDQDVANMDEEYLRRLRKSLNNITVSFAFKEDGKIPNPVETFEQAFRNYPEIMGEIKKNGFTTPFPIQCQAWPILLSGRDMIGIAQTGTGKTLAFLLPALIHTDGQEVPMDERGGPNVLILAPTRELALQIDKEVEKYSYRNIKSVCIYGGGNRKQQIRDLTKGVQIVIATPGRLNDLIQAGAVKIESITYLVLDEADRMLDMGFEPQIRKILLDLRPDKQTVMTSATWPYLVQNLAQKYMLNPIQVVVGSLDLAAVHSVTQTILIIEEEDKEEYLMDIIMGLKEDDKIIVFVDRKASVDHLSSNLSLRGVQCDSIHGDREQCDREQAISDLRSGDVRILIATDVASRGIDITDITKVVNFDFPRNIEEYVHRVGRTGRAGKTGESVTFFTRKDWSYAKELISILEEANQEVPSELYRMKDRYAAAQTKKNSSRDGDRRRSNNYHHGSYDRGSRW